VCEDALTDHDEVATLGDSRAHDRACLTAECAQQFFIERRFAGEVPIDGAACHPCRASDAIQGGRAVAALAELVQRRA
jgi:hypothetical protein